MPSASFLFSAVFCFRKVTQKIFSELDETKIQVPIFPDTTWSPEEGRRRATRPPHHMAVRVPPLLRHHMVWGPQGSPGVRPSPIYTSSMENTKYPIIIPRKVPSPPSSSTLDREGSGALPGTLPEGRSSPEGSTSPCLHPV